MGPGGAEDFTQAPFVVIWEVTRACALSCVHCRANSIPYRDRLELTTDEGTHLINQVRSFAATPPLFVLTGGDPIRRPDLAELVRHATGAGLTVALTPSGTAAATPARLAELKDAWLSRVAISLDGPTPDTHDAFRRGRGSYAWTPSAGRMAARPPASGTGAADHVSRAPQAAQSAAFATGTLIASARRPMGVHDVQPRGGDGGGALLAEPCRVNSCGSRFATGPVRRCARSSPRRCASGFLRRCGDILPGRPPRPGSALASVN